MSVFTACYSADRLLYGEIKLHPGELAAGALNEPRPQIAALEELYAARTEKDAADKLISAVRSLDCAAMCSVQDISYEDARNAVDDLIAFRVYARYFVGRYQPYGKHCAQGLNRFQHDLPAITAQLRRESNVRRTTLPGELHMMTGFAMSDGGICEQVGFDSLGCLLMYDMLRSLEHGFGLRCCPSCGRYFVPAKGNVVYCDGKAPGGDGRTCRELGAGRQHAQRVASDDAARAWKAACGRIYTKKSRGRITAQQADDMLRQCSALLEKTRLGNMDVHELDAELRKVTDTGKGENTNG